MEFKILGPGGNEIEVKPEIPDNYKGIILPQNEAISIEATFGGIVFQHFENKGFDIWYSNYAINHNTELVGKADQPMLELHIQVENMASTKWDDTKEKIVRPWQYNLTYTPYMNNVTEFKGGKVYETFDIHFSKSYLESLATSYPALDKLLENVEKRRPSTLSPADRFLSSKMVENVNELLYYPYRKGVAEFFTDVKVGDLLIKVLDAEDEAHPLHNIKLNSYEIERVYEARDILTLNLEKPLKIVELAKKVGLGQTKLKKGFSYLFGEGVFEYSQRIRLEAANILLLDTKLPVADIAFMVGYSHKENFTKAFKKYFGHTVGHLRKRINE